VVPRAAGWALLEGSAFAGPTNVPFTREEWTGDDIRFEPHLGRNSLYLGKGMVSARSVDLEDGTIEFDFAVPKQGNFAGVTFRVQSPDAFESVFFRAGASGTPEAVQYQANLLGSGTWQIFHGDDANAIADFAREQWIHVKLEIAGVEAKVYLRGSTKPVLVVPRLATGYGSGSIGFWTGPFGRGAYFANLRYTVDSSSCVIPPRPDLADGTIKDWQLSEAIDAASWQPSKLPDLGKLEWSTVHAEPWKMSGNKALGLVLINRYRRGPNVPTPADPQVTMSGRAPGSKVVFARTFVESDRAELRRLHFGYSDGVVVFLNGQPLFFGMNPFPLRALAGVMESTGEAVYLPLQVGRNEIVLAVMEFFGGWGFWTRLD
jgi:hypothetical protein